MRGMARFAAVLCAVSAFTVVATAGAGPKLSNKYADQTDERICRDEDGNQVGTVTYRGPTKMWPPNHKYAPASVVAQATNAGENATLTTEARHDQPDGDAGGNGSGNTADDITPAAASEPAEGVAPGPRQQVDFQIRSERAGSIREGRTYTIDYEATFGEDMCTGTFTIVVPHDMRNK